MCRVKQNEAVILETGQTCTTTAAVNVHLVDSMHNTRNKQGESRGELTGHGMFMA